MLICRLSLGVDDDARCASSCVGRAEHHRVADGERRIAPAGHAWSVVGGNVVVGGGVVGAGRGRRRRRDRRRRAGRPSAPATSAPLVGRRPASPSAPTSWSRPGRGRRSVDGRRPAPVVEALGDLVRLAARRWPGWRRRTSSTRRDRRRRPPAITRRGAGSRWRRSRRHQRLTRPVRIGVSIEPVRELGDRQRDRHRQRRTRRPSAATPADLADDLVDRPVVQVQPVASGCRSTASTGLPSSCPAIAPRVGDGGDDHQRRQPGQRRSRRGTATGRRRSGVTRWIVPASARRGRARPTSGDEVEQRTLRRASGRACSAPAARPSRTPAPSSSPPARVSVLRYSVSVLEMQRPPTASRRPA